MKRIVAAFCVLFPCVVAAQDVVIVPGAVWLESSAEHANGVVRFQARTVLPPHTILEVGLSFQTDSLRGPVAVNLARATLETGGVDVDGTIENLPVPPPAGIYVLTLSISSRQRDEVEQVLGGRTFPAVEQRVVLGAPSRRVADVAAELNELARALPSLEAYLRELKRWYALFGKGQLTMKTPGYAEWRETGRRELQEILQRPTGLPTSFPVAGEALNQFALRMSLEEGKLAAALASPKADRHGDDALEPVSAVVEMDRGGERLRFLIVWEASFVMARLPAEFVDDMLTFPALPSSSEWKGWAEEMKKAADMLQELFRKTAPGVTKKGDLQAMGIVVSPMLGMPEEAGTREQARQRIAEMQSLVKHFPLSVRTWEEMISAVGNAVGAERIPFPDALRKRGEAFEAAEESAFAPMKAGAE